MELEKNKRTRQLLRHLLKLEDKVNGVPFASMRRVKQVTSSHCGPAVLEELFSFLGLKVSQGAFVKSIRAKNKIKTSGLNVRDLARAANALGKGKISFWRKQNATIANLSAILDKYKYPVGVEWQGVFYEDEDEDSGHYAVITKIDRKTNYIRICDSYPKFYGVDRRFTVKYFVKRWWDVNFVKGRNITDKRMMFVITKKGETWPNKLGMKKV